MAYITLLMLLISKFYFNIILANSNHCIEDVQSSIWIQDIIGVYLDEFDFAINNFEDATNFLNEFGVVYKEQLNDTILCEKGCSLHNSCVAFKHTPSSGCIIWSQEIKFHEWRTIDLTEKLVVQKFCNYIES